MSSDWTALKEKGNEEFKKKNYQTAISIYTDAINIDSNQESLYSNRSQCYIFQKKYKKAIYDINKCLDLNPKNIKSLKRLANIQIIYGNFGDAESLIQKCIAFEPKEVEHRNDVANIKELIRKFEAAENAFNSNDFSKSEELLKNLLEKATECEKLKHLYCQSLLETRKFSELIEFVREKISDEESGSVDNFNYYIALAFYYDSKYEKAKSLVTHILQHNPDDQKCIKLNNILKVIEKKKNKANELFKNNDFNSAIEAYTNLLEIDPNNKEFNSTIYANRALCYQKLGQLTEALKDINSSIKLNENYTKAYLRRGHIYRALGNFEEARYDYERVKTKEPENYEVKRLIEELKGEEKKAKKKDYYKILELSRDATQDDIRRAYKKLAPKYHPDRNSESEESKKIAEAKFRDVSEAYQTLSDPQKKQMVDSGVDPNDPEAGGFGGAGMNIDPTDIFKVFFGGGGGGGNMGGFSSFFSGGSPFGEASFGGNRGSRGSNFQNANFSDFGDIFGNSGGFSFGGGDPFSQFSQSKKKKKK